MTVFMQSIRNSLRATVFLTHSAPTVTQPMRSWSFLSRSNPANAATFSFNADRATAAVSAIAEMVPLAA